MPTPSSKRRRATAAVLVAGAILLLAVVAAAFDWSLLRGFAERRASAALGRRVTIERLTRIDSFGLSPRMRAEGIAVAQPDWMAPGAMISVRRAEFRLPLLPLLHGTARRGIWW